MSLSGGAELVMKVDAGVKAAGPEVAKARCGGGQWLGLSHL